MFYYPLKQAKVDELTQFKIVQHVRPKEAKEEIWKHIWQEIIAVETHLKIHSQCEKGLI